MDEFKAEINKMCSPGGTKCPCCVPNWGKDKPLTSRIARARARNKTKKEIESELTTDYVFEA